MDEGECEVLDSMGYAQTNTNDYSDHSLAAGGIRLPGYRNVAVDVEIDVLRQRW